MMLTTREIHAKRALALLGTDRFTSFIRFVQGDTDCIAVRLMSEKLSAGSDIYEIFLTGEEFGFTLSSTPIEENLFQIEFGCQAGPLAGDGGEWKVQYNPDGSVSKVVPGSMWIA